MRRSTRYNRPGLSGSSRSAMLLGADGDGSTLTLDFTTGSLDSRLQFDRLSPAYFINSSGILTSVGNNVARFDHDPGTFAVRGLLIEGAASTLNSRSEDFANGYWAKVDSTIDTTTSVAGPDNVAATTRRIVESATTAQHGIRRGITTTAGTTYTFSVFVKPGSYNSFGVEVYWSAAYNAKAEVTSISGNTATVTSASGVNATLARTVLSATGWYRYALTFTHPAAVGSATPDFNVFIKQINPYAGNGTNFMDVYGVMLEAGSAASSYIQTISSTVTRVADFCRMTGTNFSSWYQGGTQGTFYADWFGGVRTGASGSTNRTVLSTDDVSTKHLHFLQTAAAGNLRVTDFGGANNVTTANTLTSGARTKGAFGYNGSSASVCLNGGTVATGSSLAFSVIPTWLVIGATSTNGTSLTDANVVLNNSIRQIKYWPTRLADGTLQGLTT
jgi:hypothetical protein